MSVFQWNKLETPNAEIGTNLAWTGTPTYSAGKFNNGMYTNSTSNYLSCANIFSGKYNKGRIEFWYKPDFGFNGTTTSDNFDHGVISTLNVPTYTAGINIEVWKTFNAGIRFFLFNSGWSVDLRIGNAFTWTAGTLFHIACVWDKDKGFDGTKTMAVYINGTQVGSSTATIGTASVAWGNLNVGFYIGDARGANGVIDNLRINDDPDVVFTNRLWEDGAGVPVSVTASSGLSGKVTIGWGAVVGDLTGYRVYRASSSGGSFSDISGLLSSATLSYDDTTVSDGVHYFYKVVSVTSLATSGYSSEVEGYSAAAAQPSNYFEVQTETLETYNTKIIVGNIDLWQRGYIDSFPVIEYYKSFDRDRIFINQLTIKASNIDGIYSIDSPSSIYKDINWRGQPVSIYDPDATLIWDGELTNIKRNHSNWSVSLISQNSLYSKRYAKIEYTSADWETGADAVKNILDTYGVTNYDENSINMSDGILTAESILLKVTVTSANNKNLAEVLEEIAKYCNADVYDYNGKIYFTVWRPATQILSQTIITDEDIMDPATVEIMDKLITNDYSIAYDGDGGTPARDADNNNLGDLSRDRNGRYSLEITGASIVLLKDLASAVWVGEMAMKRTHRDFKTNPRGLVQCSLSITMDSGVWVGLSTILKLTMQQEGWTEKLFEVYRVSLDYERRLIGLELFELGS